MGGRKVQKRGNYRKRKSQLRARRERAKQRFLVAGSMALILLLAALLFGGDLSLHDLPGNIPAVGNQVQGDATAVSDGNQVQGDAAAIPDENDGSGSESESESGKELILTYLDVGQADCTILQCGEHTMMIDGGGRSTSSEVLAAVEGLGIAQFDYIIATHGHEDHIGGLPAVLGAFPVGTVICREEESSSQIYREFKEAVKNSGAAVMVPQPGDVFAFGAATVQILAPQEPVSDLNNGSIALMLTFGERKFLFTGDAEAQSEKQMLELGLSLEADVFQAGHHGSQTSNTEAFLEAVDPVYVVISCGAGNSYGHPHSEVIARFEDLDVQIYRTDTMGTVTVRTDGKSIGITTQRK